MSPLVREEKLFKLKVAAAKLSVCVNELNDLMQKAADSKDFLKTAAVKEKLNAKEKEKRQLEEVIKSEDGAGTPQSVHSLGES